MQLSLDEGGVTHRRLDWLGEGCWARQSRNGCDVTRTCLSTFCRVTAIHTTTTLL